MKKRLLSALLALALVFVLLPTTALAEVTTGDDYDISINGRGWKFEKDTTSGAYIPVYYYHTGVFDNANNKNRTNDNLELTKKDNTVTITIRRGTSHDYRVYPIEFTLEKKSTTSGSPYDYTPCIEMGNNNNLVITGKGTLNITRDEKNGIGAALCSEVGDITITDGITVKANFLKQVSKSTVGNAISVKDHNLIISGKNTKVEARNSSCNFQDLYDVSATVCVENGEIKVSDGATLSAINNFTNSYTSQYSYYSRAISGSSSKPCALTVTGENSCVIAETDNSLGKAYGHVNFSIDGAKIEVGTSSPAQTITDINNIKNYKYAKISVPALTKTSDVFIAGGNAVVGQWTTITANSCSGSYYYDAAKKELTLKGVNIIGVKNTNNIIKAIHFTKDGTYTIKLEGANTISGNVSTGISAENLYGTSGAAVNVILSGSGSLDISANAYAIEVSNGNLTFDGTGEIKLTTGHNYVTPRNALYVAGSVTIDTTKYAIEGEKQVVNPTTEDIGNSPVFETILKGTDSTLYFKTITIAPKPSKTYYNGTAMKYGETRTVGNGTISCDENGVITLNGVTGGTLEFRSSADSTLVLEGTNTLSSIVTTQKGLTISGSGSLTVGSIRVTNNDNISADLTITDGAAVIAKSNATRAIDIKGDLTVTNGSLKATSTSDSVPTVQVGGNASFTGSTVTITNHSTTQGKQYEDSNAASSALHVNGAVTISGGTVTAEAKAGGNAIRAVGNITVSNDATVTAKNNSQYFNAITAGSATGGEVNTLYNLIVSGENTRITATNAHDNKLAYGGAINAYIENANEGHYLKANTDSKAIAPNDSTTVKSNDLTITRGDAYTTPQVAANYTIAGQTMYVGKYYKTDTDGNITDGTARDYNIYCDSANDFTLNNATISSTGKGGSTGVIMTDPNASSNEIHIKLIGKNSINNAGHHAILGEGAYSTIIIENAENASNASLTISGNYLPVYSFGNVTINAEVVIINTNGNLISTNKGGHANGAFDLGSGYKCYASASTTGNPLEEFSSANYGTYKYLCVTTRTLETGGGSTCQHDWDEAWHDTGDGHHAHQCTKCQAFDTAHQQAHDRLPDESKGLDKGHTLKCGLCGYKYDQSIIESHVWSGWETFEQYFQLGDHAQRCNCGQLGHRHLKGELVYRPLDSEYHQQICSVEGCGYPGRISKSEHVYEENSDICKYCEYDKSAPCDHTGDRAYTNNGDGTHKVTCKACGATIVEKQNHEFNPTGACIYCGATQSGGDPTPDNPGTIVIIRPAEEEKPAQQPNPSTGANDLVGLAVAAAVAAALGSAALLRKHD